MAEKEKKSSIYKGNTLNTFSDEKNKIKQAEIYPRLGGPTQTREEQALSSMFWFGCLCSREDIMTTTTLLSTQSPKRRGRRRCKNGDGLGRYGFLGRRGLLYMLYADDSETLTHYRRHTAYTDRGCRPPCCHRGTRFLRSSVAKVKTLRPAAVRDFFSTFDSRRQTVLPVFVTSGHSRIFIEIFFCILISVWTALPSPCPLTGSPVS